MFDGVDGLDVEALAGAAPGPALAATLAGLDLLSLNGYARVIVMQAWERQCSWASAHLYESMALVARSPMCMPESAAEVTEHFGEFASVEVGAALSLSPRSADAELSLAWQLAERLSATRTALGAGRINLAKARVIAHETASLSDELARDAEAFILTAAEGLTRQQLERRLRRKVLQLDPEGAEERRQDAQRGRRVRFDAGPDGTACIAGYDLPVGEVAGARAFIKDLAKTLRRDGDARTLDQLEADVFLDLLQGRHLDARAIHPKVELIAPLETWLRLGDEPAELEGFGTISADVMAEILAAARDAAADAATATASRAGAATNNATAADGTVDAHRPSVGGAGMECTWTVTSQGVVIRHGRGRYQPSRAQRRLIEAMHRTCRHPGCTRPATRCDVDHLMEYRLGGPTCTCNLIPLCRRHHRAKHQAGWWWTRGDTGTLHAQSPLGHIYTRAPDELPGSGPPARTSAAADTWPAEAVARRGRQSVAAHVATSITLDRPHVTPEQAGTPF